MPTITLSWTDLALVALTAGVIGGVALAGSQTRSSSSPTSSLNKESTNKSKGNKKKKPKSKQNESSTTSSSALPSPSLEEKKVESVSVSKPASTKKKGKENDKGLKKVTPDSLDEKEFPALGSSNGKGNSSESKEKVVEKGESNPTRPYAERMQVPARKTKVDDMIDEEVEKPIKMARVMKIVEESSGSSLAEETEVEDGWEKVPDGKKSRGPKSITLKMSTVSTPNPTGPPGSSTSNTTTAVTKRQRQNAKKKEAAKAAKEAEEAERLGRLSAHKRQQERIRMNEQSSSASNNRSSKSKEVSGGMKASIADDGKLIWE